MTQWYAESRVKHIKEQLCGFIDVLAERDSDGNSANVDIRYKILVPVPWGKTAYRSYGLKQVEMSGLSKYFRGVYTNYCNLIRRCPGELRSQTVLPALFWYEDSFGTDTGFVPFEDNGAWVFDADLYSEGMAEGWMTNYGLHGQEYALRHFGFVSSEVRGEREWFINAADYNPDMSKRYIREHFWTEIDYMEHVKY